MELPATHLGEAAFEEGTGGGSTDRVVLPVHYTRFPIEPIKFITENGLDFCTGNVIKYVVRGPHKNGIEDLKKARRYLDMMIARAEGNPDWNK